MTGWLELTGAMGLMCAGVYLSVKLRFVQVRKLPDALKGAFSRDRDACGGGAISPMQAICTALAGTMGTGNIAGVAGALALGGPGAVFWMWAAAFFGMALKYAEAALAVRYRRRSAQGEWLGGPMYYMEAGLGAKYRPQAKVFCLCGVLASLGMGNAAQVNTLCGSLHTLLQAFGLGGREAAVRLLAGAALALLTLALVLGGARRIARAAEGLIPFVSVTYLLSMLAVISSHAQRILPVFRLIFTSAFAPRAMLGGAAGITLKKAIGTGVVRGIFTNEAGMGSSAMAHAAAHGATPHRQGLWGIFEVFADTMVVCTVTALGILCSGCEIPYGESVGAEVTTQALSTVFGPRMSAALIALCMVCFALSTLMAWSFYGLRCVEYLARGRGKKTYLILFSLLVVPFSVMDTAKMWSMAEGFTLLMALCNVPSLLLLCREIMQMEKKDA